ncbi:MAG: hypothetical protein R1F52_02595 [Candidatus Nitrosoabyssus spongiisocia]|nr:MAG: hypothetical protein R1F52_02595 [Nitrosopumilaceae archaeon AB1(1)]
MCKIGFLKTIPRISPYQTIKNVTTIPKYTQFSTSGSRVVIVSIIALEINIDAASNIPNSIACHIHDGNDSLGMCTLLCDGNIKM